MSVAQHLLDPADNDPAAADDPSSASNPDEPPIEPKQVSPTLRMVHRIGRWMDRLYGSPNPQVRAFYSRDAVASGRRTREEDLNDTASRAAR